MKNFIYLSLVLSMMVPTAGFSAEMAGPVAPKIMDMRPNGLVTPRVLFGPTERLANEPLAKFFRKSLIDYFHIRYPSTVDKTNAPDHEVKIIVKSLKVEPAKEAAPATVNMLIKISVKRGSTQLGMVELPIAMETKELNEAAFQTITNEAVSQVHEYLQRVGI